MGEAALFVLVHNLMILKFGGWGGNRTRHRLSLHEPSDGSFSNHVTLSRAYHPFSYPAFTGGKDLNIIY